MISMTTVDYLQRLIDARFGDDLRLVTGHLMTTGRPIALVVDFEALDRGTEFCSTLAVLKPGKTAFVDTDGELTDAAHAAFASLRSAAMDGNNDAWLCEAADGHVSVVFAAHGAAVESDAALITLPWADPKTLFATMPTGT